MELPAGWKFTPLHAHCPSCGQDLSERFENTEADESETDNIEEHTNGFVISGVAGQDSARMISTACHDLSLKRMIDPLPETDEKQACRNRRSRQGWVGLEHSSAGKKKDETADHHQNVIPVIKSKLR